MKTKKKVLIFIISYNHETLLTKVLERIPESLAEHPNANFEVLIIEDCSIDNTFKAGYEFLQTYLRFKTTILSNPVNQGFGGNQKLGYQYAIDHGFDHVVLIHGDGQYAPELIPELVEPLLQETADAVFGSRMLKSREALKGGMPFYKWVGNKILTRFENFLMGSNLSEWHSGFRLYSVKALKRIPFQYNSNYYDFDTQIIIQLLGLQLRIKEMPIPTFYGEEVCNVNGLKYARKILMSCLLFKAQDMGIFYHPCFYLKERHQKELERMSFDSSTSRVISRIRELAGNTLVILDNERTEVKRELAQIGERITVLTPEDDFSAREKRRFNTVVFMDTFESAPQIEELLHTLRHSENTRSAHFIVVGANVGFLLIRLALLFGKLNYGVRGILDFRHRRLFTFSTAKRLIQFHGFQIIASNGIPVPWPLVFQNKFLIWLFTSVGATCLRCSKSLFAYQYYFEFKPLPSVEELLASAQTNTEKIIANLEQESGALSQRHQ